MKNSLFFTYYEKGTQVLYRNWFYIIPYSLFCEKYEKGTGKYHFSTFGTTHIEKSEIDYVLVDQHQVNYPNVISYKKHSLKNIFANYVDPTVPIPSSLIAYHYTLNLITFSKYINIDELISVIFVGTYHDQDVMDKVKKFIGETIKEYEKL